MQDLVVGPHARARSVRILVMIVFLLVLDYGISNRVCSDVRRENIIALLRHQEQLVGSMTCEYELICVATRAQDLVRIPEACRQIGDRPEHFVISADFAEKRNCRVRWIRDGQMERAETYYVGSIEASITTFDGQFVRQLTSPRSGSIDTTKSFHWHDSNRLSPYSMLYEFQHVPYSRLLEQASDLRIQDVVKNGKKEFEIAFRHPHIAEKSFVMQYDELGRLNKRSMAVNFPGRKETVWETHEFMGYKAHPHASGEIIWFPSIGVFHFYIGGAIVNGSPVEYMSIRLEMKEVMFNSEVPTELFTINFPPDCIVRDGVYGFEAPIVDHLHWGGLLHDSSSSIAHWVIIAASIVLALVVWCMVWSRIGQTGSATTSKS